MASCVDGHKSQPTLCVGIPLDTNTSFDSRLFSVTYFSTLMPVRDDQWLSRRFLEPLVSVPGHVLDGGQAPVGQEQKVLQAMGNNSVVGQLNDTRQRAQGAGSRCKPVEAGESAPGKATVSFIVGCWWYMEHLFYVLPVEITVGPVVHDTLWSWAPISQVVSVEARVDFESSCQNVAPDTAAWLILVRCGKYLFRRGICQDL